MTISKKQAQKTAKLFPGRVAAVRKATAQHDPDAYKRYKKIAKSPHADRILRAAFRLNASKAHNQRDNAKPQPKPRSNSPKGGATTTALKPKPKPKPKVIVKKKG